MPTINYYNEGSLANSYLANWSNSNTYTMSSISGLGTVTCHGPNFGNYTLTLTNLPAHSRLRYKFYWHFVDSLDNEQSSVSIDGQLYARLYKTGFPGAGTPGAPNYDYNIFSAATWTPASYSYEPWGSGSTANGYVAFDTGFIDHFSSTLTVSHNLGHDQGQSDEAMYLSHVEVILYQPIGQIITDGLILRLDASKANSFPGSQRFVFSANLVGLNQNVTFSHYHIGGAIPGQFVLNTTTTKPPIPTSTTTTSTTSSTTTTTTDSPTPFTVNLSTNLSGTILGHQTPILTILLSSIPNAGSFTIDDMVAAGPGTLSNFSLVNATGTVQFTPNLDVVGSFSVFIPGRSFFNTSTIWNDRSNTITYTVNTIRPEIAVTTNKASINSTEIASLTFTTSNATADFSSTDITVTGPGTLSAFNAVSSTVYTANITGNVNSLGTVSVNVAAASFTNAIGNRNKVSNLVSIAVDTRRPSMVITTDDALLTSGQTANITFTSNIATSNFTLSNVTVTGPGTLTNFTAISSTVYTAVLTPNASGSVNISVAANSFTSTAGNFNTESNLIETAVSLASTTTTSSTTTTLGPASVTLSGPGCFNESGSSQFTVTFSQPVTGFTDPTIIENASYGIDVTAITPVDSSIYTVDAVQGGIPYAIIGQGSSTMNGTTGLTEIFNTPSTTGSPGDDSVVTHTLPFAITFPTSATTTTSGTNIVIGTNSFIALGSYSGNGLPPGPTLPPIPAILIGARDAGCYRMYAGSLDGNSTYIIRWEGTRLYSENVYNRAWEVTFYAANPTRFTISIDGTLWENTTDGVSFIKNANTIIYPKTGNLPIAKGQVITVDAGNYTIQIPAGAGLNTYGVSSAASNTLVIPPC